MTQYARPSADVATINWGNSSGALMNLFAEINEEVPNDTSFIQTIIVAPVNEHYVCKLAGGAIVDPGVDTGHILKVRLRKNPANGAALDYLVELRQSYVDEALQGDLIDSWEVQDVDGNFTTHVLDIADASAITDYADLFVRVAANQP